MKNKQTKWQILELFLAGPGTRMELFNRNPSLSETMKWESFKRILGMLRADGFIESAPHPVNPELTSIRLTTKGRKSVEGWRIVRERGQHNG